MSVRFGYYPLHCDVCIGDITITTLPGLEQKVGGLESGPGIDGDWVYAPAHEGRPSRIFGLPRTHALTHQNADSLEHLDFLIWCIGFFVGMRLTATEAGFLDATPIKLGKLTDFVLTHRDLREVISLAESFWQTHRGSQRDVKRLIGIIHALFLSHYPANLQFERFVYLYTALDGCHALATSVHKPFPGLSHAKRIDWTCQRLGISTSSWAKPGATISTAISAVRNGTLHEALFFDEPLGFAYGGNSAFHRDNIPLQMEALVCRLLVALLGKAGCEYVTSPVDTRQRFGLDLS